MRAEVEMAEMTANPLIREHPDFRLFTTPHTRKPPTIRVLECR